MKVYGGHLDRFRSAVLGQLGGNNPALQRVLQLYADGAMALATDADTIDVSIDMAADLATIDVAIVPKANSELATFVAAQTPSELGMIDKLPGTPAPLLLVAGKLALGPYHAGFRGMIDVFYASMATTPDVATAIEGVMSAASGSFALTWRLDPTGAVLTQVLSLDDPAKANAAIDKGLAAVAAGIHDAGPAHLDYSGVPATQHEGVAIRGYGMGPANGPVAQVLLATVDRTLVVASGATAEDRIGTTIDVAHGKAGHFMAPATWVTMIERAKKDKDSVAIVLDLARLGASTPDQVSVPMLVGIGFDTAVHVHLAVPPSAMQAFMP